MNYQEQLNLLRNYQVQNPVKYKQKYGDAMPEEVAGKLAPNIPVIVRGVKVDVKPKETAKAAEIEFSMPEIKVITPTKAPVEAVEKPKRGRKLKNG